MPDTGRAAANAFRFSALSRIRFQRKIRDRRVKEQTAGDNPICIVATQPIYSGLPRKASPRGLAFLGISQPRKFHQIRKAKNEDRPFPHPPDVGNPRRDCRSLPIPARGVRTENCCDKYRPTRHKTQLADRSSISRRQPATNFGDSCRQQTIQPKNRTRTIRKPARKHRKPLPKPA